MVPNILLNLGKIVWYMRVAPAMQLLMARMARIDGAYVWVSGARKDEFEPVDGVPKAVMDLDHDGREFRK